MKKFDTLAALIACTGQEVAISDWVTVTQDHIDQFASATGDEQWIHVDPERAAAGPFGATIAHGFLTLSMIAGLAEKTLHIGDLRMGINYGLNRVRFPAPVPVGSRLRLRMTLNSVEAIQGGHQLVWTSTVEIDGGDKPACVAETVGRYFA